jgi:hypothetical protein
VQACHHFWLQPQFQPVLLRNQESGLLPRNFYLSTTRARMPSNGQTSPKAQLCLKLSMLTCQSVHQSTSSTKAEFLLQSSKDNNQWWQSHQCQHRFQIGQVMTPKI